MDVLGFFRSRPVRRPDPWPALDIYPPCRHCGERLSSAAPGHNCEGMRRAEIGRAVALLRALGYAVTPPPARNPYPALARIEP